jgi:hypothetical protein
MIPNGQKLVNADWNKFAPTNAVKANAHLDTNRGLLSTPSANENMTKRPANMSM